MRQVSIFFLLLLPTLSYCQEKKVFTIQPGQRIDEVLKLEEIYKYPKFVAADIGFKDGSTSRSLLNYNYLYGEMQFIAQKGDTLSIDNSSAINIIKINNDTFYFDKEFVQVIAAANDLKLGEKQFIKLLDIKRAGAYGLPTMNSVSSYSSYSGNNQTIAITAKEFTTLEQDADYFLGDKYNRFVKMNNKSILKMFSKKSKEVEKYLNENNINYNKREDVLKLFSFLQSI
jgi:hypothetical protein